MTLINKKVVLVILNKRISLKILTKSVIKTMGILTDVRLSSVYVAMDSCKGRFKDPEKDWAANFGTNKLEQINKARDFVIETQDWSRSEIRDATDSQGNLIDTDAIYGGNHEGYPIAYFEVKNFSKVSEKIHKYFKELTGHTQREFAKIYGDSPHSIIVGPISATGALYKEIVDLIN